MHCNVHQRHCLCCINSYYIGPELSAALTCIACNASETLFAGRVEEGHCIAVSWTISQTVCCKDGNVALHCSVLQWIVFVCIAVFFFVVFFWIIFVCSHQLVLHCSFLAPDNASVDCIASEQFCCISLLSNVLHCIILCFVAHHCTATCFKKVLT